MVAARNDDGYWWWWWTVIGGGKFPCICRISGGGDNGKTANVVAVAAEPHPQPLPNGKPLEKGEKQGSYIEAIIARKFGFRWNKCSNICSLF